MLAPSCTVQGLWVVSFLTSLSSLQLGEKGIYKAIHELDILLPWIQAYIQTIIWRTRKRQTACRFCANKRSLPKRHENQPSAGCTMGLEVTPSYWRKASVIQWHKEGFFSRAFMVGLAQLLHLSCSTRAVPRAVTASSGPAWLPAVM